MRIITQHVFGGPEVLELAEVDRPEPGPGEVLVRVAAVGVNPADWKLRSGQVQRLGEPPFTLGYEVSGTVESLGERAAGFVAGDEVFGLIFQRFGAYADYVLAPAEYLAPKPASLDHVHAAALPCGGLTAWQPLTVLAAGQRVLVHAAAGGVGHLAVQIAKARGAYVIGTARAANHEFLRELGVDEPIDYTTTDFAEAVQDVDLVLDLIGGDYVDRSLRTLTPTGHLFDAVTPDEQAAAHAAADSRYTRVYVRPSAKDLTDLTELVEDGRLRPTVRQVFPLTEVAAAHRLQETGRVRGKLVLVP